MDYKDINDSELTYLINENDETAKEIMYEKYKYIIDIKVNKYQKVAKILGIEYKDLYQDALVGFVDAINNYNDDKAKISTFINICVDRKLKSTLRNANTFKNRFNLEALSLEHEYEYFKQPLMYIISDKNKNNPLLNLENEEQTKEIIKKITNELSTSEKEIFYLMIKGLDYKEIALILNKTPKQIDNARVRIKNKVKNILNL